MNERESSYITSEIQSEFTSYPFIVLHDTPCCVLKKCCKAYKKKGKHCKKCPKI